MQPCMRRCFSILLQEYKSLPSSCGTVFIWKRPAVCSTGFSARPLASRAALSKQTRLRLSVRQGCFECMLHLSLNPGINTSPLALGSEAARLHIHSRQQRREEVHAVKIFTNAIVDKLPIPNVRGWRETTRLDTGKDKEGDKRKLLHEQAALEGQQALDTSLPAARGRPVQQKPHPSNRPLRSSPLNHQKRSCTTPGSAP